jgi:hypothetical protein
MTGEKRVSDVEDGTGAQPISNTDEEIESGGKGSHDEREKERMKSERSTDGQPRVLRTRNHRLLRSKDL